MSEKKEEMTSSELWAALMALPRPSRMLPVPRNIPGTNTPVGEVMVWPLTQEEQMSANAEADRWTKKLLRDPQKREEANLGYHHTYTNEVAIQVLYLACRDPKSEGKRPAFPSPSLMREHFTTDEIGVLFNGYCTVQLELGPIRAHMTQAESEALTVRLVEGGSAYPFESLSWEAQRTQVLTLASQLVSCWTAMSSAGLPLSVTSVAREYLALRAHRAAQESAVTNDTTVEESEP
jgi:hypothetical protein